ncbi:MAG: hypothetical protein OEN23_05360 [Paracoccaceae bacterium]|nr:hypothetical protein [Paracoccaceae bacterium]
MSGPDQLARLARLLGLARRAAEMRLSAERAEATRQRARIAELKAAIVAPLENARDLARGGLIAEAAWRAHLDALLRRETQALAGTEARIAVSRQNLAHAFGRERAALGLAADARAEALRLAERRAEGQSIPARGRGHSRSSPSGSSADSGAGSPGMA